MFPDHRRVRGLASFLIWHDGLGRATQSSRWISAAMFWPSGLAQPDSASLVLLAGGKTHGNAPFPRALVFVRVFRVRRG
jgi:hypothetical protein